MKNFESFLAPQLNEYLAYRQSLGYSIRVSRYHLLVFDTYLRQTNADWDSLQPFFFLEMRANIEMEPRDVNRVFSSVRVFFRFLLRRDYVAENPLQDIPFLKENTIIPFVFSPDEIDQLLEAMCKRVRKTNGYFLTDLALYLAVLLLARCGMRISEPLQVLRQHYRRDDASLYRKNQVQKTKTYPLAPIRSHRNRKLSLCAETPLPC